MVSFTLFLSLACDSSRFECREPPVFIYIRTMPLKPNSVSTDHVCRCCNVKVVDPTICPICNAAYHLSCSRSRTKLLPSGGYAKCCGVAKSRSPSPTSDVLVTLATELKALPKPVTEGFSKNDESFNQLCSDAHDIKNKIDTVESNVAIVNTRLEKAEGRLENLEKNHPSSISSSEYTFTEWELCLKAKPNIVIFGMPEAIIDSKFDLTTDKLAFFDLLKSILNPTPESLFNDTNDINISRIGKFSVGRLYSMERANLIFDIFKKARETLRACTIYKNVICAQDKTTTTILQGTKSCTSGATKQREK